MPKFLTTLRMDLIDDSGNGIYQLVAPFAYRSDIVESFIMAPAGFVTDLASVPRLPLTWWLAGGTNQRGAVLHDWLYSPMCKDAVTRKQADDILYEAGLLSSMPSWRAWLMWSAVRAFGSRFWKAR